MAASMIESNSLSRAMERNGQWVFSPDVPTDVVIEVGDASFNLHKFMLVAKSNYIRELIMESEEPDLARIDLSDIPGGPEAFEKAAKFCYGVNFEITVHNAAALRCAAEYLQMTDEYCCDGNLAGRAEDFLSQVALRSLSGAVVVLKSCEDLLPKAEDLNIVKRCVEVASAKANNEANFPSRSPPNWWTEELSILDISSFNKIITAMKSLGAKPLTVASGIITYTEKSLHNLVRDHSGNGARKSSDSDVRIQQRVLLSSIVALMPVEKAVFPINFLCCLLRSAIFLGCANSCKNEIENRISAVLEHVTVDDLMILTVSYDGGRLLDLESARRILAGFVEKENSAGVFGSSLGEVCSAAMQRVAKTVDVYLGEIGGYGELSISKFNGIANLVPKAARKTDDDLYRAIDIYLKAHPNLDEIGREKACGVMDPLKLSYEARVHASQNKRLPLQILLHALYYDQLKLRSGVDDRASVQNAVTTRSQVQADVSLVRENEALRAELMTMKMYVTDLKKNIGTPSSSKGGGARKSTFFSSVGKTLGKLNPFRHGSKDTSNIEDVVDTTKPRRRRFSIS
ncbi:root phototropism protein 2 [Rhododendron vialii]|uniref:root phototropism protein 2 n=1 Tax=Rhododendron vialii TaxID=182163 RepID=UPI00265F0937|nr:root phototropism protein 2 [Rhododendron vialii]